MGGEVYQPGDIIRMENMQLQGDPFIVGEAGEGLDGIFAEKESGIVEGMDEQFRIGVAGEGAGLKLINIAGGRMGIFKYLRVTGPVSSLQAHFTNFYMLYGCECLQLRQGKARGFFDPY